MKYWNDQLSFIAGALGAWLHEKGVFDKRNEYADYVSRCMNKGFCKTEDEARLCAERYYSGKRAVTPPGTARRKKLAKQQEKLRSMIPAELRSAVSDVVSKNEKAVSQFKAGNEKAVNALIGQVMRMHKTDAVIIKELIVETIKGATDGAA